MWIFHWIKLPWYSCFMSDKPGRLNWFWKYLDEGLSSFNPKRNNWLVDLLKKCGLYSDYQHGLWSSWLTADLLTDVSDGMSWAVNRFGATRAVALYLPKAFDRVWHGSPLQKLISYEILSHVFGRISSKLIFTILYL